MERLWMIALLIFPFVLWVLPSTFFDESEVIMCPSRLFFGVECFGCGITRGVMHMHHAEVADALYFNFGSPFVYPALIALWAFWVYRGGQRLNWWKGIGKSAA
ncbi:MAG: DUF2752 domain-containing protein [Bacteroidia bacterium]|nr:DUF2752 domain-containing protein [Bacteroidia bacterium]